MGSGFQFLDIIFFALIAAFLVLRLRSVLGRRDGFGGQPHDPVAPPGQGDADNENVMPLPDYSRPPVADEIADAKPAQESGPADPATAGLAQIRQADPSFDIEEFLVGARTAFEMIIRAFAAGDTDTLRPLLSREVFGNFAAAIAKREEAGETQETNVASIRASDIVEAGADGSAATVTVKFVSDQSNVTRDHEGRVVEGDPETTTEVTDFWTFSRSLRSHDPNWTLVATGTLD